MNAYCIIDKATTYNDQEKKMTTLHRSLHIHFVLLYLFLKNVCYIELRISRRSTFGIHNIYSSYLSLIS